jgi:hypothetical protein
MDVLYYVTVFLITVIKKWEINFRLTNFRLKNGFGRRLPCAKRQIYEHQS